jgi:hypothetical protein
MSGKGKGRAVPEKVEKQPQKSDEPPEESSMLSRVAASARGLTRSAFIAPTSNELNDRAAAALANAGKGQSSAGSGTGSTAWADTSQIPQPSTFQAGGSNAFKTGHNEEHVRQSENEFSSFLDGIDSFTPSKNFGVAQDLGDQKMQFSQAWEQAGIRQDARFRSTTVAEQESRDGEDVLALLSESGAVENQFEAPPDHEEDFDWGLTVEQLSKLQAITKELFPPPEPHGNISVGNPLNLAPNFDPSESSMYSHFSAKSSTEHWREQWEGVLTRYTDEVWGNLLSLVKEARKEVEEMRDGASASTQPKALRRLETILGHLRK